MTPRPFRPQATEGAESYTAAIAPREAIATPTRHARAARLLAAVEVVPLAASAAPVVVRGLRVGQVVGVLGLHVVEAGGLVEVRSLGVQGRGVLAVEGLENLRAARRSGPVHSRQRARHGRLPCSRVGGPHAVAGAYGAPEPVARSRGARHARFARAAAR